MESEAGETDAALEGRAQSVKNTFTKEGGVDKQIPKDDSEKAKEWAAGWRKQTRSALNALGYSNSQAVRIHGASDPYALSQIIAEAGCRPKGLR